MKNTVYEGSHEKYSNMCLEFGAFTWKTVFKLHLDNNDLLSYGYSSRKKGFGVRSFLNNLVMKFDLNHKYNVPDAVNWLMT